MSNSILGRIKDKLDFPERTVRSMVNEAVRFVPEAAKGGKKAVESLRVLPEAKREVEAKANKALKLQEDARRYQEAGDFYGARALMKRAEQERNASHGLAESIVTDYKTTAKDSANAGVKALLTALGVRAGVVPIVESGIIGGLVGGGSAALNKEDIAQGIGMGLGNAPAIAGATSIIKPAVQAARKGHVWIDKGNNSLKKIDLFNKTPMVRAK